MIREIRVPGDKSISHRSLIFASLAGGRSRVRSILMSQDVHSTAGVLRSYGVRVPELSADMEIAGVGMRGLQPPAGDLDCGNSGTTARLMMGVAAALPFASRFTGDASLSRRPMKRLARTLEAMGAKFEFANSDGLPMTVLGARNGLRDHEFINETASAQIKSAVILAGLMAGSTIRVVEPRKSRDHTENMLEALGASITRDIDSVTVRPTRSLSAIDVDVPADPSSGAFFASLAAMSPSTPVKLANICLNPTRLGFYDALKRMGAAIEIVEGKTLSIGERVGSVVVHGQPLRGISLQRADIPALVDELPLIACLATRAEGETRVEGAEELRLKESDRIKTIVDNLRSIGADAEELTDGFQVRQSNNPLRGQIKTHGDHRIAMAFGILSSLPGNQIEIDDPDCVGVSYPGFWEQLASIGNQR